MIIVGLVLLMLGLSYVYDTTTNLVWKLSIALAFASTSIVFFAFSNGIILLVLNAFGMYFWGKRVSYCYNLMKK